MGQWQMDSHIMPRDIHDLIGLTDTSHRPQPNKIYHNKIISEGIRQLRNKEFLIHWMRLIKTTNNGNIDENIATWNKVLQLGGRHFLSHSAAQSHRQRNAHVYYMHTWHSGQEIGNLQRSEMSENAWIHIFMKLEVIPQLTKQK